MVVSQNVNRSTATAINCDLRTGDVRGTGLRLPRIWTWMAVAAATLAMAGNVVGLLAVDRIYGEETPALVNAAIAQDIVGLVVLGPLLLALAVGASRGSLGSWLCLLGGLSFTTYNYAIYAFSVHFGPLFLVWVVVLGLSSAALVGGLATLDRAVVFARFAGTAVRGAGWFLVVVAALFGLLWLREIVPDLLAGRPSSSAVDWDVPTNPVHVLDLAFFLPAVVASGVLLLRGHWLGYTTAAGQLVFLGLTCLPVLVTPFVAQARGDEPGWSVLVPIGIVAIATAVVLARLLRRTTRRPGRR